MGASFVRKLDEALAGVSALGFDTSPVIYFIEANPRYDKLVTSVFKRIENGDIFGFTSVVTLSEVLVQPIQNSDQKLRQQYRDLLIYSANFFTRSITADVAETAAELRARYQIRTPDALQIGTAIATRCDAFLCNDKNLQRVKEIRILILDELKL